MSRYERHGSRSLVYSKWHRFYLGDQEPMIDLDGVEYCMERGCFKPLALIETARDIGQPQKATTVLRRLAEQSGVLALCVLYTVIPGTDEDVGCMCKPRATLDGCSHGISSFRVRRVFPEPPAGKRGFSRMKPEEFRDRLRQVRLNHFAAEHQMWDS